ncbi:MAG: hypothetical protein OK449_02545 [Thaumarchaeota archaeon]|nr:hypothetical protein [Nitrososphaerota archaeon]
MKIILGTFKDNADELAEFLAPRVGGKAEVGGGELNFDDAGVKKTIKSRHVKTYIKRFLNKKGERANYQIQVEGQQLRLIELEGPEEEEKEEKEKKAAPKVEEKAAKKALEDKPAEQEAEVAAQADAGKVEEEARGEKEEEEKKEGALSEEATKKQTKPKRKKAD